MTKRGARPRINPKRIERFAGLIKTLPLPNEKPLNFYSFHERNGSETIASDMYPPLNAPWAIDFFFFACIHNYGFWHGEEKYEGPLYGTLNGKQVKGSDLLWKLLLRAATFNKNALSPEHLVNMMLSDYCRMFSDDNGPISLFISDERYALTLAYGRWFIARRMTGADARAEFLARLNYYPDPLGALCSIITHKEDGIPGYREDPLKKKALLLLMALANRPEHFIVSRKDFAWDPIVDYHLMRLALRLGLVVLPEDWKTENTGRKFTSSEREEAIRKTVSRAIKSVITKSGRPMTEINNLMWSARRFCPEMEKPNCAECVLANVCAKKVGLFQPVVRTIAY